MNDDLEPDEELTAEELDWINKAVDAAITKKILEKDGVHTFPAAKGLH
jgi:hypothetical protein